jgi:hypothetical protein
MRSVPAWLVWLSAGATGSTEHYVDGSVARAGDGASWASAWQQLSDIDWANVAPGDAIRISGGRNGTVYRETLTVGASGSAGQQVTITRGEGLGRAASPVIDGEYQRSYGVVLADRNYVTVSGLRVVRHHEAGLVVRGARAGVVIEDNQIYSGDPGGGNARGIDARDNRGERALVVRRNRYGTPGHSEAQTDGIWSSGNQGVVFECNRIVIANHNTVGHSDGIQSFHDHEITIRRNWIEQRNDAATDNHGLWLSNSQAGGWIEVQDNVVLTPNLTADSSVTHWAEPVWNEVASVRFTHNLVVGGRRSINLEKSPRTEIIGNIIMPVPGGFGVFIAEANVEPSRIDRNLHWGPSAATGHIGGRALDWVTWRQLGFDANGLQADPGFVDPARGDLREKSGSIGLSGLRGFGPAWLSDPQPSAATSCVPPGEGT